MEGWFQGKVKGRSMGGSMGSARVDQANMVSHTQDWLIRHRIGSHGRENEKR
jgi:hypothetical protein